MSTTPVVKSKDALKQFSKNLEHRLCTIKERVDRVHQWCESRMGSDPPKPVDDMDREELRELASRMWVDDKHRVIWCDVPKAG